ncbi:hypothetical protein MW332_004774 [Vibrio parahaemolyticus]|nr:hypothetical protein [Vibrio parahaemolyticus]
MLLIVLGCGVFIFIVSVSVPYLMPVINFFFDTGIDIQPTEHHLTLVAMSIAISAFLVAFANFKLKSESKIKFIVSKVEDQSPQKKRLHLINEKDRNEVILHVYMRSKGCESICIYSMKDKPLNLPSFGCTSFDFDALNEIRNRNHNAAAKVTILLGSGKKLVASPVKGWWDWGTYSG